MKRKFIIYAVFLPLYSLSQVGETFSDGNFTENPVWEGMSDHFVIDNFQLRSNAPSASKSYLFTASQAMSNAEWECRVKITYPTSANNYASVYLVSDRTDVSQACRAYYVKIGGTNDEVSLFLQEGTKHTKIIDGTDKRTDGNPVELTVKVTRDEDGNFKLYSKPDSEAEFQLEGTTKNTVVTNSSYFGLLFSNTNTTGKYYFFDDIFVTGNKVIDTEPPTLRWLAIESPDKLVLEFSEAVDISKASFSVDNRMGAPDNAELSADNIRLILSFPETFAPGTVYTIELDGVTDLSGNRLTENIKKFALSEEPEYGDVVFNEIMFDSPNESLEYIELANSGNKALDLSGLIFTVRKADGSLNTGVKIPEGTLLLPDDYIAFCTDAQTVSTHHRCPVGSHILSVAQWTALNNESATLVLTNADKTEIFDELTYSAKWHQSLIKNRRGVALEKIHPHLATQDATSWHSAGSEYHFGTPGYKNAQYRELFPPADADNLIWLDPPIFTPDNDGLNDLCFIRYTTESAGYMASIQILGANGQHLTTVCSTALLSTEGFFIWDGTTESGKTANPSIYVVYAEIFHPEKGIHRQVKLPIIISMRK
ncbi:MAG: lamin tail domain-containing protein [Prevotellaceae bacterium]|jgi:hypothetical protein|nr:lamin tail domain-containing protein [Prevotellaceae bacterium]